MLIQDGLDINYAYAIVEKPTTRTHGAAKDS